MKEAQNVVKILAASSNREAEALANCTEVNAISIQLNSLVFVSPESTQVLVYCDRIIASRNLVCNETE